MMPIRKWRFSLRSSANIWYFQRKKGRWYLNGDHANIPSPNTSYQMLSTNLTAPSVLTDFEQPWSIRSPYSEHLTSFLKIISVGKSAQKSEGSKFFVHNFLDKSPMSFWVPTFFWGGPRSTMRLAAHVAYHASRRSALGPPGVAS